MAILFNIILWLVVLGLVWWLVGMLPLPAPVFQIIRVIFIAMLILIVLSLFGVLPGFHLPVIRLPF